MVLAVFEGALRKWMFVESQQTVYLIKDFLLLGAYARFFGERAVKRRRLLDPHPANWSLLCLGLLGLLQLANSALQNVWVGLFGLKAYLLYAPLLYLVPAVFTSAESLHRFCLRYLALSLIPLVLGPIQFTSPPDSILNQYVWSDELAPGVAVFGEGGAVRITGTFSYISGYTAYLILLFLFECALLLFGIQSWSRWRLLALLTLTLTNLVMTGSRGPFMALGVGIPVMVMCAMRTRTRGTMRAAAVLSVSLPLVVLLSGTAFPEAHRELLERTRENEDIPERVLGIVWEPVWAAGDAGISGYGIGSTHQAAAHLLSPDFTSVAPPAEGEWERIILEIGIPGFALLLLVRFLIAYQLWIAMANCRVENRPFLAAALVYSLVSLPGNLVFNHTASIFYWFLAGFALIPGVQEPAVGKKPWIYTHERRWTASVH